jgi:hypothetical protein
VKRIEVCWAYTTGIGKKHNEVHQTLSGKGGRREESEGIQGRGELVQSKLYASTELLP